MKSSHTDQYVRSLLLLLPFEPKTTRENIVACAFEEIWKHGFQSASVDNILAKAGVTKGALYYYFKSKREVGFAVIEEIVRTSVIEVWQPLLKQEDPINGIIQIIGQMVDCLSAEELLFGCPLNNLTQEMAPIDEEFRTRLESIFQDWRSIIEKSIKHGQETGFVDPNVSPRSVAVFIISLCEGTVTQAKNSKDLSIFSDCTHSFQLFLNSLRPQ